MGEEGRAVVTIVFRLLHKMTTTGNYHMIAHRHRIRISQLLFSLIFPSEVLECVESSKLKVNEGLKAKLSLIIIKLIQIAAVPLATVGNCIEFLLNLLSHNGGLLKTLFRLFTGRNIVIPTRGSETFLSFVGLLEHRINLYDGTHKCGLTRNHLINSGGINSTIEGGRGSRFHADLCVMASTAAYENGLVIRNRVTKHWKMHFVEFFDCRNDYLKEKSTQAFIFCDKEQDAQLIVIAFRGTDTFDANDWEIDFDFSWSQFDQLGKVHLGFLEALGLANRSKISENRKSSVFTSCELPVDDKEDPGTPPLAYYVLLKRLKELLQIHTNAKFMVTGHSLGGALAVLFSAILFMKKEKTVLEKLLAVYTFGQPRVGDEVFANFMNNQLNNPVPRYFRIVYCNDIVPRLPCDDGVFLYKHFGVCLYYNSCYGYHEKSQPNRDFSLLYFIPIRINAVWELAQSLLLHYIKGREFKETKLSRLFRIVGLMIPGISSHSPVNYINAVRLGPSTLNPTMFTPPHSKAMLSNDRED